MKVEKKECESCAYGKDRDKGWHCPVCQYTPIEAASNKGDEKFQAVETFPGGFKVGDRVKATTDEKRGTVTPWAKLKGKTIENGLGTSNGIPRGPDLVPILYDDGECGFVWPSSLEHIKEEVTPAATPEHEPDQACDDGAESKHHDEIPDQDDVVQALCLMCGASVDAAHELEHRRSMECIQAREYPPTKLDTWKCHCGAAGRYIDLQEPFTDCPRCGGEVQDS